MSDKIHILDEITCPQSRWVELRDAVHSRYLPSARQRSMTLEGMWRSPPVELADRSITLHILWSVPNIGAWWGMRLGAARANPNLDVEIEGDDEKIAWWRYVDGIALSRKRIFMLNAGDSLDV